MGVMPGVSVMLLDFVLRAVRRREAESVIDLRKRRLWADGDQQDEDDGEDDNGGDASKAGKYNPGDLDEAVKIIRSLENRLSERDAKIDGLSERLGAIEKAQRKRLEDEGRHEELLRQVQAENEELKARATRADALDKTIREINQKKLEMIPEDMLHVVPVDDLPPERLAQWLDNSMDWLRPQRAPELDGGKGTGERRKGEPALSDEERATAKMLGVSEEDMLKAKQKGVATYDEE
jgi:hypothetical protein